MFCKIQLEKSNHDIFCKEDGAVREIIGRLRCLFGDPEDVPKKVMKESRMMNWILRVF